MTTPRFFIHEVAQINTIIHDMIYDNGYYINDINKLIFEVEV